MSGAVQGPVSGAPSGRERPDPPVRRSSRWRERASAVVDVLVRGGLATARAWLPRWLRRLVRHEVAWVASLARWVTRRGPHGVGAGDTAVGYARGQSAASYGFLFVSIVETVALAYLVPWPLVHRITLVIDVWGVLFVLGLHASCVVRPHVVGADGSLRLRYGALVDVRVPADHIHSARLHLRSPTGHLIQVDQVDDAGSADLIVGGQTTLTVELSEPVHFLRPLGRPVTARTLRFYADDPRAALAALTAARSTTNG